MLFVENLYGNLAYFAETIFPYLSCCIAIICSAKHQLAIIK